MKDPKQKAENIFSEINNQLQRNLNTKIDEMITEGLRRKGFNFSERSELEEFIKTRCRAEEDEMLKQKIFYVDETPFLLWVYEYKVTPEYDQVKGHSISAEAGSFKYL